MRGSARQAEGGQSGRDDGADQKDGDGMTQNQKKGLGLNILWGLLLLGSSAIALVRDGNHWGWAVLFGYLSFLESRKL